MPDLDEPVHLVEHRSEWASAFAAEQRRLAKSLSLDLACIQHIGSTSVPGLVAKPIIDIMVGVPAYPPSAAVKQGLMRLGYEALGEAGVSGRAYFRVRGGRSINVAVVALHAGHWVRNLALREHLRKSRAARESYTRAKCEAVASGAITLLAYSEAKSRVVAQLLREAGVSENDG
jgi:GrpB-like predicted nucleotidyltransferase (UPF0157 family)